MDNKTKEQEINLETITRKIELKQVLSDVEYTYANHAALASSKWDIRIAFGDITPDGKVTPSKGVIMPFLVAKNLTRALQKLVDGVEDSMGEIIDPDVGAPNAVDIEDEAKNTKSSQG